MGADNPFACPTCGAKLRLCEECYRDINPRTGRPQVSTYIHVAYRLECCGEEHHTFTKADMPELWKRNPKRMP